MEKKKRGRPRKNNDIQGEEYWKNRLKDDSKRDWGYGAGSWIEDYCLSIDHSHRRLIVEALEGFNGSILEVGCNCGANLKLIQDKYPEIQLAGIDVNADVIERAKEFLPKPIFKVASVLNIPFEDKEFEVVIADAVFMYIEDIARALTEIDRVVRRGVVIVDWSDGASEKVKEFHWVRDYKALLEALGFDVSVKKLTKEEWPSENWEKNGYIFIARRR